MDSITEAMGAGTVIRFERLGQGGIILEKVYVWSLSVNIELMDSVIPRIIRS